MTTTSEHRCALCDELRRRCCDSTIGEQHRDYCRPVNVVDTRLGVRFPIHDRMARARPDPVKDPNWALRRQSFDG